MRAIGVAAALLLVALAACSDDDAAAPSSSTTTTTAPAPAARFPGDEWERVDPAEAGLDVAVLDALAADAEAAGSTCLVVARDGALVYERTFGDGRGGAGTPREAFSVTKSVTSTLVGIAQDDGSLSLSDPAAEYIPEWAGTPAEAVTVRNLLANDSGRHWDLGTDYGQMALAERDKTAFSIGLAQDAAPGEVWAYNNSAIQTLSRVLEAATGERPGEFAERRLFGPIGMDETTMSTDGAGNVMTFMGLRTTCPDLARFGHLFLHGGEWDGEQIVSAEFVEEATGQPSTPLNAAYGLLWWLNHEGPLVSPLVAVAAQGGTEVTTGQLAPGAPEDVFWALGFQGQIVAVIPSEGIVAVRMGTAPPPEAPFTQTDLTMGVLEAIEE